MQKNILNGLIEITTLENKNKNPKNPCEVFFLGFFWVGFFTANPDLNT